MVTLEKSLSSCTSAMYLSLISTTRWPLGTCVFTLHCDPSWQKSKRDHVCETASLGHVNLLSFTRSINLNLPTYTNQKKIVGQFCRVKKPWLHNIMCEEQTLNDWLFCELFCTVWTGNWPKSNCVGLAISCCDVAVEVIPSMNSPLSIAVFQVWEQPSPSVVVVALHYMSRCVERCGASASDRWVGSLAFITAVTWRSREDNKS